MKNNSVDTVSVPTVTEIGIHEWAACHSPYCFKMWFLFC